MLAIQEMVLLQLKLINAPRFIKTHHMIDLLELFPDFDFEDEPAHDASFGQSM